MTDRSLWVRSIVGLALLGLSACVAVGPVQGQDPGGDWPPADERPAPPPVPGETAAEVPPDEPEEAPDDPRLTAGGVLRFFMASRSYRTIRDLKSAMGSALVARFDRDSSPFCGKRNIRIAAFEYAEKDLKPVPLKTAKTAGVKPPPAETGSVPAGPAAYTATVRSLWEEQGEAVERRTETLRLSRGDDTLWRVADLQRSVADNLRFTETVDGVTIVRMVLRAWHKGDPAAARPHLGASFLKRYDARPEALQVLFKGGNGAARHAAYQIVEMKAAGDAATARIRLLRASGTDPASLEGEPGTLRLARRGGRWYIDAWD
ncbi:MAG: hypothetical protein ACRD5D_09195 [Candidatus Polarisedimenticolia bacterium]